MKYDKAIECLNRERNRLLRLNVRIYMINKKEERKLEVDNYTQDIKQIESAIKILKRAQHPLWSKLSCDIYDLLTEIADKYDKS